jgi:hypothetical protein
MHVYLVSYRPRQQIRTQSQGGVNIGFLSLPAPNANIAVAVSAPSSSQLFLIERLVVHYLLNPRASLYLGVGALGSPSNTEILLGVKLPR